MMPLPHLTLYSNAMQLCFGPLIDDDVTAVDVLAVCFTLPIVQPVCL